MKPLLVCYYDNVICAQNPAEKVYRFVKSLLDWIETHEAHLIIKTKERPAFWGWKGEKTWWRLWRKWGRHLPKEIYKFYPQDLQDQISRMKDSGKLEFQHGKDNIHPAIMADVIVILPQGDIIHKLWKYRKKIWFFDIQGRYTTDTTFFYKPEEVGDLLNAVTNRV